MADVFISYSKGDASPLVKKIGDALDRAGISCWYMEKDSLSGRYAGVITNAIRECRVFLVVLNERSNQSNDVLSEVGIAFKSDKAILPFNLDNCKLSDDLFYHLNLYTMVSANPSEEKSIQDLVKRITNMLRKIPAKIIKRGECGENVTYELDENNVLTIFGKGPMKDYPNIDENAPWWNERETISYALILNGVTSIGAFAFFGCMGLVSVDIPDSVTSVGSFAFRDCMGLVGVDIPDSVTYIGYRAFYDCYKLKSVSVSARAKIDDSFPDTTRIIVRPQK